MSATQHDELVSETVRAIATTTEENAEKSVGGAFTHLAACRAVERTGESLRTRWCAPLASNESRGVVNGELSGFEFRNGRERRPGAPALATTVALGPREPETTLKPNEDAGLIWQETKSRSTFLTARSSAVDFLAVRAGSSRITTRHKRCSEKIDNPAQFRRSGTEERRTWPL